MTAIRFTTPQPRLKRILGSLLIGVSASCAAQAAPDSILLTNQSDVNLTDKPVAIARADFGKAADDGNYPVFLDADEQPLPAQLLDQNSDGIWDEVMLLVDLKAKEKASYHLEWLSQEPAYPKRTSVRFGKRDSASSPVTPRNEETLAADKVHKALVYQPYQTDGPTWENDKIGFRHYFDGRNIKDLFGKRIPAISPENVGVSADGAVVDNYHTMAPWGRDILPVGTSVGLGGFALLKDDALLKVGILPDATLNNVSESHFSILQEGPVLSSLELSYNDWHPTKDHSYNAKEQIQIWPGHYAYQNTVSVEGLEGDETLMVGLPKVASEKPYKEVFANDQWVVLSTHDQQTYDREWWLGMAIIVPKERYEGTMKAPEEGPVTHSYLAKLKINDGDSVTYYAAAGWELSDPQFKDEAFFNAMVENLVKQLSAQVSVSLR